MAVPPLFDVGTMTTGALNLSGELVWVPSANLMQPPAPGCRRWSYHDPAQRPHVHRLCGAPCPRTRGTGAQRSGCIILHGVDGQAHLRRVLELTRVGDIENIHLIECDVL